MDIIKLYTLSFPKKHNIAIIDKIFFKLGINNG
jgi:hypothetical protein